MLSCWWQVSTTRSYTVTVTAACHNSTIVFCCWGAVQCQRQWKKLLKAAAGLIIILRNMICGTNITSQHQNFLKIMDRCGNKVHFLIITEPKQSFLKRGKGNYAKDSKKRGNHQQSLKYFCFAGEKVHISKLLVLNQIDKFGDTCLWTSSSLSFSFFTSIFPVLPVATGKWIDTTSACCQLSLWTHGAAEVILLLHHASCTHCCRSQWKLHAFWFIQITCRASTQWSFSMDGSKAG